MRMLQRDKKIFIVTIAGWYWSDTNEHWDQMTEEEQDAIRNKFYDFFDRQLTSSKPTLTIFCPIRNGEPAFTLRQVAGKKRSRIQYTSNINDVRLAKGWPRPTKN